MRLHRVVIGGIPILMIVFAIYLGTLYGQLRDAFNRQEAIHPNSNLFGCDQNRGSANPRLRRDEAQKPGLHHGLDGF